MDKNIVMFFLPLLFLPWIFSVFGEMKIEVAVPPVIHGEGPHWDFENRVLYYVDITNQTVHKYIPDKNVVNSVYIDGGPVSLVIPDSVSNNKFILGRGRDVLKMLWDGISQKPQSIEVLATVDEDKPENRLNDGKADVMGRLWFGTMGPENPDLRLHQGSLYSVSSIDGYRPVKHVSPVSVSNGIGWNDGNNIMYYIDSPTRVVNAFDFDVINQKLSNRREFFNLENHNVTGVPDGLCMDKNENLWVAVYGGGCLLNIDGKNGKLLKKIDMPVTQVTSCAFGGKNLTDLYVTSSKVSLTKNDLMKQPLAGALFKIIGLNICGQERINKFTFL